MNDQVTRAILRARPGHLVLISCNPATLARDLARLAGGDAAAYEILAVRPVDMFPQTPHVESVVSLRAKAGTLLSAPSCERAAPGGRPFPA